MCRREYLSEYRNVIVWNSHEPLNHTLHPQLRRCINVNSNFCTAKTETAASGVWMLSFSLLTLFLFLVWNITRWWGERIQQHLQRGSACVCFQNMTGWFMDVRLCQVCECLLPLPVQSSKSSWQTETIHTAPHTTTRKHFYSLKEGFPSAAHTEKDEQQWTLWGVFEDLKHGTLNPSLHMDCTWRQQLG